MGLFSFLNRKESRSWSELILQNKETLAEDFIVLTLEKETGSAFDASFIPGQYVTLEINNHDEIVRRSYSICGKTPTGFKIGVKKIADGKMSTYLHTQTQLGDKLKVHMAEGNFVLNGEQTVVAFVAGSGITPLISMLEAHADKKNFYVFYNTKKLSDLIFHEELKSTKATVYLSQETVEGYKSGRLDYEALMEELKENLALLQSDAYLLCGPEGFMAEIERCLLFFGVPEGKIRKEYFIPPSVSSNDAPIVPSIQGSSLTVELDGQVHTLNVGSKKKTILEIVEGEKLDPPYSCRGGVCSSCKAKIITGTATMRQNFTLSDKEVAEGYILTCQAEITSEEIRISFDA